MPHARHAAHAETRVLQLLLSLLLFASCFYAVSAQSNSSRDNQEVDEFIREHNEKRAKNPDGLLFTVRLKDKRKQFHHGEVITLELSFASSKPATFTLDAATYDRSGRLHSDGFRLDPRDGVVDPLHDYFHSKLDGFIMGGLRSIPDLTDKPYLITVELNEWQRIDKPGHYRLYVVSGRVGRKDGEGIGVFLDNAGSSVYSNVVEFDVLPPDKKWATQKLNETISALSKRGEEHRSACITLRYLGTIEAVIEMRKRFRGDDNRCEWEYKFGLIGSPHRDFVIRDMENAISLREQPVTAHFISTLALLELIKRVGTAPPYPAGSEEQINKWQTLIDQHRALYDELSLHYVQQLSMAIPQKQGQARATSLQTLLDYRSKASASDFSQWSTLLVSLPEVFKRLPRDDQRHLLEYQWKLIASPAMAPVLRDVLKYTYKNSYTLEELIDVFDGQNLRSLAVRRLYELSPEEGRRLILDDIRRPKPRFNQDVLSSLPDETLPELDNVLIANLEEARRTGAYTEVTSELIERYASDQILSRVRAVYDSRETGKWECRTQAALLAYFFRIDSSLAGEYLNKALASRAKGLAHCYTQVLKNVAALHMSAKMEEVATSALDDEDYQVVSEAASVLAEHGSADAEKALWRRLEKLHEAMQARSEEFNDDDELSDEEAIERALRAALITGQAWLMNPEKLERLRDLCLTEESRDEVDKKISGWVPQIYVAFHSFDGEPSAIGVAHYEMKSIDSLKKKLLQFPKGTVFKLKTATYRIDESKAEEVVREIENYLAEHGMKLKHESEK